MTNGNRSVAAGLVLWAVLAALHLFGRTPFGTIDLYFLLAPLATVPLGIGLLIRRRGDDPLTRLAVLMQPPAAISAVVAAWLDPGVPAFVASLPWLGIAALLALAAARRLATDRRFSLTDLGCDLAAINLAIGGAWLGAHHLGWAPLGFGEPIVLLTALHFHFSGFAAPILVAETLRAAVNPQTTLRLAAVGIYLGTPAIAAGFTLSPYLLIAGVAMLAVSLMTLAVHMLRLAPTIAPALARGLLRVAALAIVPGMVLALIYSSGEVSAQHIISIGAMARTHGPLNGIGFSLGGLLGWTLAYRPTTSDAA